MPHIYICPLCRHGFNETENPKAEKLASSEAGKILKVPCPHCRRPISLYEALQSAKASKTNEVLPDKLQSELLESKNKP